MLKTRTMSVATKHKISKALSGRPLDKEHRIKIGLGVRISHLYAQAGLPRPSLA